MKRIPRNAVFLGLTHDGLSVYVTDTGLIAKKQPPPPWHTTIVTLLVDLHRISPTEYAELRQKQRDLSEIFIDRRLLGYPAWTWLYKQHRYRFKPVDKYFLSADRLIRNSRPTDDNDDGGES